MTIVPPWSRGNGILEKQVRTVVCRKISLFPTLQGGLSRICCCDWALSWKTLLHPFIYVFPVTPLIQLPVRVGSEVQLPGDNFMTH